MRHLVLSINFLASFFFVKAQISPQKIDSTFEDIIYVNQLNGMEIYSDSFHSLIDQKIEKNRKKINFNTTYPEVYFTTKNRMQFLKVYSAPDFGFGWFYTIGYTKNSFCNNCGSYTGSLNFSEFITNNGIKLGCDFDEVNEKMHLVYFRRFSFMGIVYFYFEKGFEQKEPFVIPREIFYYKSKGNKLIEMGFGRGFANFNPMLLPE